MITQETNQVPTPEPSRIPTRGTDKGLYNSITVTVSPQDCFEICKSPLTVEKILSDLPEGVENFLSLDLLNATATTTEEYEVRWKNSSASKVQGFLVLNLLRAPANRGTMIIANGLFKSLADKHEASDLMYVFLKRLKALVETGEIASTKGQPSGREELKSSQLNSLH